MSNTENKIPTRISRTRKAAGKRTLDRRTRGARSLSPALAGAAAGASAWLAYAAIETFFSVILPWFMVESYDYRPFHRAFNVMVFFLYPAIGAALGAAIGAISKRNGQFLRSAALITVIFAFDINLVVHYPFSYFSVKVTVFISLVFAAAAALGMFSKRVGAINGFMVNPWSAFVSIAGIMWLVKDHLWDATAAKKGIVVLVYLGIIVGISLILQLAAMRLSSKSSNNRLGRGRNAKTDAGRAQDKTPVHSSLSTAIVVSIIAMLASLVPYQSVLVEPSSARSASKATNVVVIVMDTVRADHLSVYGYERETTPNLEKFAAEAVVYENAIAPGAMTLSSHASLFSGLYPRAHGAHFDPWAGYPGGKPLDEGFTTLTEHLAARGYRTVGVAANIAFLSHAFRIDQGFQHFDCRWPRVFLSDAWGYYIRRGVRDILTNFSTPEKFDKFYRNAGEINEKILPLLDEAARQSHPTFMFVNYMDAHDPYTPPAPFDALYPGKIEGYTANDYNALTQAVLKREAKVSPRVREHLISQYDGGITYVDDRIGEVFERMKELDRYDESLIIVTSDHGEAFGEKDHFEHGNSVYQDQVHVPLIIKPPFSKKHAVVSEPVSLVDIMPTVLTHAGIKPPDGLHGQDILTDTPDAGRKVLAESYPDGFIVNWGDDRFNGVRRAVVEETDKFIGFTRGTKELYDLSTDPNEERDLYSPGNPAAVRLDKALTAWIEATVEHTGKAESMSREAAERLKALGYVQ